MPQVMPVVTRFAPSPTGELHLGSAYSARIARDRARAAGGTFLVRVEDIDIRATLIRMYSGERAIVPNSSVYTNAIVVKTASPARRGKIEIAVDDPRPPTDVRDNILKLIEKTPGVMSDPAPSIAISNVNGTSMRFTVYLWSPQPLLAQDRVLTAIRDAFEAGKAEITAG